MKTAAVLVTLFCLAAAASFALLCWGFHLMNERTRRA